MRRRSKRLWCCSAIVDLDVLWCEDVVLKEGQYERESSQRGADNSYRVGKVRLSAVDAIVRH